MYVLIIPIIVIILLYILISYFIFKRKLNIAEKRLYPFSKNRSKLFLTLEYISIVTFAVTSIIYINRYDSIDFSPTFIPKLSIILFFVIQLIRGSELFVLNNEKKSHYYPYLGSVMLLVVFFYLNYVESYLG